ncbi:hypothetical protein [Massilia sp. CCM 8734]|nr:hypothetical protein [Massilia sp. CCM 8734]
MKPDADKSMTVLIPADLAGHLQAIKEGIAQADHGQFASASEVNSFFAK